MADSAIEIRNAVLAHVRKNHPDICRHWFDDIEPIAYHEKTLYLLVDQAVRLKYLKRMCAEPFNTAVQEITGNLLPVKFLDEQEAVKIREKTLKAPANRKRAKKAKKTDSIPDPRLAPPTQNTIDPIASSATNKTSAEAADIDIVPNVINQHSSNGVSKDSAYRDTDLQHPDYEEMFIHPDNTFDNFVVGPDNRLAHAAAKAVADRPGHVYNPYFIHGGVGLGKTHLLQAICQQLMATQPEKQIYYTSCKALLDKFMAAIAEGVAESFRDRFRNVDVLVVDDIHFLTKRMRQGQEEFFHTFNTLHQSGRQIILSSDAAPDVIPDLEERLSSRFGNGLVFEVSTPCFETRVAILHKKARIRGMELPSEVAAHIAEALDANVRRLEGAINNLVIMAGKSDGEITLDMADTAIGEQRPRKDRQAPSIDRIIEVVSQYYNVRVADLLSDIKTHSVTQPRQTCMWLARELTRFSYKEIGGYFGGRDHSTVIHAQRRVEKKRKTDEELARELSYLEKKLSE